MGGECGGSFERLVGGRAVQAQVPVLGGMLDPAIDEPGKPFSYFWHPTDVIGALYAPVASEVTPEGYIYTGFGELMFFVGLPLEPLNVRIKTLQEGYLPIVHYQISRHDIDYQLVAFAADLGGGLEGMPVNLVQVHLRNRAREPRAALFSSAWRFSPLVENLGDRPPGYRFSQRFDLIPKQYTEGQTAFNPDWKYSFGNDAVAARRPDPVRLSARSAAGPVQPDPGGQGLAESSLLHGRSRKRRSVPGGQVRYARGRGDVSGSAATR